MPSLPPVGPCCPSVDDVRPPSFRGRGRLALGLVAASVLLSAGGGCKTLSERYIALEVWKYERCFGHPPPGFVGGPAAAAAPAAMRPCSGPAGAPCAPAYAAAPGGCDACGGAPGMAGPPMMGGAPMMADPGIGMPTPAPAPMSAGRPVIISDEIVSP
jgi:hypothetical protein